MSQPAPDPSPRSRAGGRAARRALRSAFDTTMLPGLTNALPFCEIMDGAQVERIDAASMDILENVGVVFRDDIALADWRKAGAKVVGERVYLDRGLVRALIATIPEHFTYHARNPAHNIPLGGKRAMFIPMTGAPYLRDLDDVRRNPVLDDLAMFHKLSHMLPALHSSAHHIVEPYDHPISQRHLRITYSSMKYSDKTFMGMTTSPKNAEDVIEMCAILFGDDFIDTHPVVTGNCNGNSPLVWDETMLGAMRAFCRRGQPVLCSPFVLGGANTPASVPATVAQLNAEALSALAYTQVIRTGAPAIYGHYLSTVSMKSGAPMAGTPEIAQMNFMIGQMARLHRSARRADAPCLHFRRGGVFVDPHALCPQPLRDAANEPCRLQHHRPGRIEPRTVVTAARERPHICRVQHLRLFAKAAEVGGVAGIMRLGPRVPFLPAQHRVGAQIADRAGRQFRRQGFGAEKGGKG